MAMLAGPAHGAFTLIGLTIEDAVARQVVERYTLARQLQPVRFLGSLRTTEWLLDRPPLAATLARHLHPPLERYHVRDKGDGVYTVDDQGALRGEFRLVARGLDRRVYLVEGQFRSLAYILSLSGSMVFTLEYRETRQGSESYVEVTPQLFVRLNNVAAHAILKVLAPLIHGVIDRRVANLTAAAEVVGQRVAKDPIGLYREMRTWPDIRPEDVEAFRLAFSNGEEG
ncbi:MAG TPA: hypothetical protein VLM91_16230 [Candidatus Methylomirabilis sp.]|nr:hypothetical protein [Candidatus Methylomirabilis sp.]